MSSGTGLMFLLLVLGIVAKSGIITVAAGTLLAVRILHLQAVFPILENRGLEAGLVLLVISVLVPFAAGRVPGGEIIRSFFSVPGVIAVVSGMLATQMNSRGLEMLQRVPSMMIGLVVGSILGVVFFGGIPVGPLMAGGIAALLLGIWGLIR